MIRPVPRATFRGPLGALAAGLLLIAAPHPASALQLEGLSPEERETPDAILEALEPGLTARKRDGTAILLTWDELYAPIDARGRAWLDDVRALKAEQLGATSHYFGEGAPPDLVPVGPQGIRKDGADIPLDPQYLPREVKDAYDRMMAAMAQDLGRRLLIESGYRSPAYQLYLFLFYLPKHGYSIRETNRFVALPGHSEHGHPPRQAIDFINEDGINGEDQPEQFEALPEYRWLERRAAEFGFHLSYPRDNALNTAFEPWHWRYESHGQESVVSDE